MNWLFVTSKFPWPLRHGLWLRVFGLACALRDAGESVSLLSFPPHDDSAAERYQSCGITLLPPAAGEHLTAGKGAIPLSPYVFQKSLADQLYGGVSHFDCVILFGPAMLQYAPEVQPAKLVLHDLVDDPILEIRRRSVSETGGWLKRTKTLLGYRLYEKHYAPKTGGAILVSETDSETVSQRGHYPHVSIVPNGVDLKYFTRPAMRVQGVPDRHETIVFIGHMSNPNNVRAAMFLARQIMPLVRKEHPKAILQLVGADPVQEIRDLHGPEVLVTGMVTDIRPYLWNASVVAAPMLSGTGIKNKILEAWAASAPVVATRLASQGLAAEHDMHLLIGETAPELAAEMNRLLDDAALRESIARAGQIKVAQEFTWAIAAEKLMNLV